MTEAVAEVKPGRTTVTGETVDAFVVQKMAEKAGAGNPVSAEAAESVRADQPGSGESGVTDGVSNGGNDGKTPDGDPETDAEIKKAGKKNPKIEARFHDLAERRKAAEAEAKTAKEEAQRLRDEHAATARERDELKNKYEPPKPEVLPPEPTRQQFTTDDDYKAALLDWAGDKREHDLKKQEAEDRAKKEHETRIANWKERETAAQKEIPDYSAKIAAATDIMISDPVRDAIVESDVGPQLLYHLATNPDVVKKINGLTVASGLKEIGKIEARLTDKKEGAPKTTLAEVSKAPAPITPLKGGGALETGPVDSDGNFHGSFQQYQAWKKKQQAAGKWR